MKKIKIGGACLNQTPLNWSNNLKHIREAIHVARHESIQILCLPELCVTAYGCEDLFLSEWLPAKALEKLGEIVPETIGIAVAVGLPVRLDGHVYNTTCFMADGDILGFYAKQKLANDGVHYEPRWFSPWEPGRVIDFEWNGNAYPFGHITVAHLDLKIGFEICEDAWREDRPACHLVNSGVDLILNPSASHFAFGKAAFRENLVISSSELIKATYLYTNLLGNEAGRMIYDGDILIAQKGKLLARNSRLSFQDFNVLGIEVDFGLTGASETHIQPDSHDPNVEFTKAAPLALFDYLRKSRSQGFVLSLSGGADSSTIAVLVAEMIRGGLRELGFDAFQRKLGLLLPSADPMEITQALLQVAYQGTVNSSEDTFLSAKKLAESIGASFYHWRIDTEVNAYQHDVQKALGVELNWQEHDIAMQNIQARARSPIIWMVANLKNCLLLSTSNRSEGDVGYATMDGDTSGSISPIAAVSKTFVLQWLRFAQKELGYTGLAYVNQLTPTAELRPLENKQTDEQDLMPYAVLAAIEREAIRNRKSPVETFALLKNQWSDESLLKEWITRFFRMWAINQWKRERLAPSFHLDDFNVDPRTWCRFPILSGGFQEELDELNQGTGS